MSDTVTLHGTVYQMEPVMRVGKNDTPKQTVVIDNGRKYQNLAPVNFFGADAVEIVASAQVRSGDKVEVDVYIGGREYNGKFYADIAGQDIRVIDKTPPEFQDAPPITDDSGKDEIDQQLDDLNF